MDLDLRGPRQVALQPDLLVPVGGRHVLQYGGRLHHEGGTLSFAVVDALSMALQRRFLPLSTDIMVWPRHTCLLLLVFINYVI